MMQSDHDAKLIDAEYERARDAGELDERFAAEASARRRTAPVSPGTGENMSKGQHTHTPGPWRVTARDCGDNIFGGKDGSLRIANTYGTTELSEGAANARLIAAAPELLAACEAVLHEHDDTYDGGPISSGMVDAVELLRAAIAAAREGASQ
jgi:hypothetical protein